MWVERSLSSNAQVSNERTHEHHEQRIKTQREFCDASRTRYLSVSRTHSTRACERLHSPITVVHEGPQERERNKQRALRVAAYGHGVWN